MDGTARRAFCETSRGRSSGTRRHDVGSGGVAGQTIGGDLDSTAGAHTRRESPGRHIRVPHER